MEQHGGQVEIRPGGPARHGLARELAVGVALSILLAVLVGLAGSAMTAPTDAPAVRWVVPIIDGSQPEDFNPRDPLVRCEALETHIHCIREES
jgi:hypothetical protein